MKILLLRNDFYKIDESYKNSSGTKEDYAQNLLKMTMRVTKMREAKTLVGKIVGMVWNRIQKITDLRLLLKNEWVEEGDAEKASRSYCELVRTSYRICQLIDNLKADEKYLIRPFIFQGVQYDGAQHHMYEELKKLREKILLKHQNNRKIM